MLTCLFIFVAAGCNTSVNNTSIAEKIIVGTPTSNPASLLTHVPSQFPTNKPTEEPTAIPDVTLAVAENNTSEEALDDLSEFKSLQDCFSDYDFQIESSDSDDMSNSFEVSGKIDLDSDGIEDSISIHLQGRYNNLSFIEINHVKQIFNIDRSYEGEVRIVDVDRNDSYLEVACLDEGPSGDPIYIFFRYDGINVYELGSIDAYALIDGKGKLISSFHYVWMLKPSFCSAWYEIQNNTFVIKNNKIEKYLNQTYDFVGGNGYFIPYDELPENPDIQWEETTDFQAGKVKLIDMLNSNYYYVEFPDGEKGLMYFWIGD